jgi:HTH-type transcriptional regulator/antitoxin HipB
VGLQQKTISTLERLPDNSKILNLFKLLSALNLEIIIRERDSADDTANDAEW